MTNSHTDVTRIALVAEVLHRITPRPAEGNIIFRTDFRELLVFRYEAITWHQPVVFLFASTGQNSEQNRRIYWGNINIMCEQRQQAPNMRDRGVSRGTSRQSERDDLKSEQTHSKNDFWAEALYLNYPVKRIANER